MRDLVILFVHIIATLARLLGPGGIRSVVAESVLIKQQLLILNRSRQRAPNLRSSDRLVAGPFGPGLCLRFDEKSRRYFRFLSVRWRLKRVEGFGTIAERIRRAGRMRRAHKAIPSTSPAWTPNPMIL